MGTPHYHPCTGDCPDGLLAGSLTPAAPSGDRYEPSDPADWYPGAGWERVRREMPHVAQELGDEVTLQIKSAPGVSEAFIAAFKEALDHPLQILPPDRPTAAEVRAAVFAQLRANLDAIHGTKASRPLIGETYVVYRREQIEEWLNKQEGLTEEQPHDR